MPVTAASVAPVVRLAPVAQMPPRLWAVPVGPAEMPAWLVSVPRVWLVLTALWCRGTASMAAPVVLVALAETAALVEQAAVEPQAVVAAAVWGWRPLAAPVVLVASAVPGLMRAV